MVGLPRKFGDLQDSIASVVMICLEIWYFMTIIVLTGHLEDSFIAVGSLSIWSIPQKQS